MMCHFTAAILRLIGSNAGEANIGLADIQLIHAPSDVIMDIDWFANIMFSIVRI
jgi:hypothetical protein